MPLRNITYMAGSNQFTGKLGFILVSAAAAIGLANIWRFPYLAAQYGGGTFVLIYLIFVVTLGFTLITAEIAIGRKTGKSPLKAFQSLCGKHPLFTKIAGILPVIISLLTVSYYAIITGWLLKYCLSYLTNSGELLAADNGAFFSAYIGGSIEPIIWTLVVFVISAAVLCFGVQKGLQRVCIVLVPALIVCMAGLAVYVLTLPGGIDGLLYCLVPDFSKFSLDAVIAAMGQTFFSLSIGAGIYITYGMYLSKKENIEKSVHSIEIFDTGAALLAMILIVPMVFAFSGGNPEALGSGSALLFEQIPQVLTTLPNGGMVIGSIFFLVVFAAALTSVFSLIEVPVSAISLHFSISRKKTLALICSIAAILSVLVNFGYSIWKDVTFFGKPILDALDSLVSNALMPVAVILCCILVGWMIDTKEITDEIENDGQRFRWKKFFVIMIKYIAPVCILIIMISNIIAQFV